MVPGTDIITLVLGAVTLAVVEKGGHERKGLQVKRPERRLFRRSRRKQMRA